MHGLLHDCKCCKQSVQSSEGCKLLLMTLATTMPSGGMKVVRPIA